MIIIHAQGEQRAEGRPDDVFWICSLVHTLARRNMAIGRGVVRLSGNYVQFMSQTFSPRDCRALAV